MTTKRSIKKIQDMESLKNEENEEFLFKNVMQMMILWHCMMSSSFIVKGENQFFLLVCGVKRTLSMGGIGHERSFIVSLFPQVFHFHPIMIESKERHF